MAWCWWVSGLVSDLGGWVNGLVGEWLGEGLGGGG